MSSQGSSSVKVLSGAAFASDPLSREVSKPNASSTESTPEVASSPADKRVTRTTYEAVSTSGHFSEEEKEDEVVVSYEDL